jgi:hypothetical protein
MSFGFESESKRRILTSALEKGCIDCNAYEYKRRSSERREPINDISPIVRDVVRSPGQPLARDARAFMEPRFGQDFSQVRIHADAKAAESARSLNAIAYTIGKDVVLGSGAGNLQSEREKKLLAHELTHVVQQASGFSAGSYESAEREAQSKSQTISKGLVGSPGIKNHYQGIQLDEDEPKNKRELERGSLKKAGEEAKYPFKFNADLEVPLAGQFFDLRKLQLDLKGLERKLGLSESEIRALEMKLALQIAEYELKRIKEYSTRLGNFKLGASLTPSSSFQYSLKGDKSVFGPNFGMTGKLEAGYRYRLPSQLGEIGIGAKLEASSELTQPFGGGAPAMEAEAKGSLSGSYQYQLPLRRGPGWTLGGMLGSRGGPFFRAESSLTTGIGTEKGFGTSLSSGARLGLSGERDNKEKTQIYLSIRGDGNLDLSRFQIDARSQSLYLGLGVKGYF